MVRGHDARVRYRALEELAARVVAAESGVECRPLDLPGSGPGLADFALRAPEGDGAGLLEVTSHTDEEMLNTVSSAARRIQRHLPGSRFYWGITLDGQRARITQLGRRLPPILMELERRAATAGKRESGVLIVGPCGGGREESDPGDELHTLGVVAVEMLADVPENDRGTIAIATAMGVHTVTADAVTRGVERELAKPDNQAKLRKAGPGLRAELFVWLDSPQLRIAAFRALGPEAVQRDRIVDRPTLPPGVTAVWTAPTPVGGDVVPYWYSDGRTWESRTWTSESDAGSGEAVCPKP